MLKIIIFVWFSGVFIRKKKNLTSFCKFSSLIRIRIVDLKSIWISLIWIRNRHPLTNYVSVFMQDWRWEVCPARPCSTSFLQPSSSLRSESTIIQQSTLQLVSKFGQLCAQYCWDHFSQKQPLCFMTYVDLKDPNRCAGIRIFPVTRSDLIPVLLYGSELFYIKS